MRAHLYLQKIQNDDELKFLSNERTWLSSNDSHGGEQKRTTVIVSWHSHKFKTKRSNDFDRDSISMQINGLTRRSLPMTI